MRARWSSSRSPEARKRAHRLGHRAEARAAWFLRLKGYRILALRAQLAGVEVDIVARRGDMLVLVEVKARAQHADGAYAVTAHKRNRMERAALALLATPWARECVKSAGRGVHSAPTIRFDVITIVPRRWPQHIANAWSADHVYV